MSGHSNATFGGRYRVVEPIASGGMAHVFLAEDEQLKRKVAIKVLSDRHSAQDRSVERFRREARALAQLNHPHIVSVYDWGEQADAHYLVMEFVAGQNLAQRIERSGPLSPAQALPIVVSAASALSAAHQHGLVHRDVKPANILLSRTGAVKVTDFGIALNQAATTSGNLTAAGSLMGTATYLSPEQAMGHHVDGRSDLYSLGVVLYELLAGVPPFVGGNQISVAYRHVQEEVEPLAERGVGVPEAVNDMVMKLLSKKPQDRYQTADELIGVAERISAELVAANGGATPEPIPNATPGAALDPLLGDTSVASTPVERTSVSKIPQTAELAVAADTDVLPLAAETSGGWPTAKLVTAAGIVVLVGLALVALRPDGDGSDIALQTSSEQPEAAVLVPDLVNRPERDAREQLEDLGFDVDVAPAPNGGPAGLVTATSPPAGQPAGIDNTVILMVAPESDPVIPRDADGPEASAIPVAAPTATAVPPTPVPPTPVPENAVKLDSVKLRGKELKVKLYNEGAADATVVSMQIQFPDQNGPLFEIGRGKHDIFSSDDGLNSPASIGPQQWNGDRSELHIERDERAEYTFRFDHGRGNEDDYLVTFVFEDGSQLNVAG